jgi:hypothetical protein
MTLPVAPHITTSWAQVVAPIKPGEKNSWRVFALQSALKYRDYDVVVDGDYDPGMGTEKAVRRFQRVNNLVEDGIVGLVTQRQLLKKVEARVDSVVVVDELPSAPRGLVFGLMMKETSGLLAPTNDFDPSPSDIGTDCGCLQWRVPGPPYDLEKLKSAFDPAAAIIRALYDNDKGLLPRFVRVTKAQPQIPLITRWRAAIIAHNAPFLYEQIVRSGRLTTPDRIAGWTIKPTGGHYTHKEWFYVYTDEVLSYVAEL